jgi:hypothetical protein
MSRSKAYTALAAALLLAAPIKSATSFELTSMPVSLIVQETCSIQSADLIAPIVKPAVTCVHNAPFDISQVPLDPTARRGTTDASPVQLVAFHDAQQTVWMVNF